MKNTWLRAEEQAVVKPSPVKKGCKQLQLRDRPTVVMTPAQTRPHSVVVPPRDQRPRPETSPAYPGHEFAIRKDMITETIRSTYRDSATTCRNPFWINHDTRTKRKLERANKLLEGVLKSCTAHDGIPKPGNHIVRNVEKKLYPTLKRAQSVPRFSFLDDNFLTFGTFDVELRPGWDESLLMSSDAKTAEKRRQRVKIMKRKLVEMNAITNAVKEVITVYSRSNFEYIKDQMRFTVPVYLNNHEIHAWKALSNLLFVYSRSFQLIHMEELADVCGLDDRKENPKIDVRHFRFQHPEIYHFVCYCNLLLGGTKAFISAKFLLLRDLEMLLGLIKGISPLNIPLENLKAASAFRLREVKHMKQLATNKSLGSQHPSQMNNPSMSSKPSTGRPLARQPPVQTWTKSDSSAQHQSRWDDNVSWASACPSKLSMYTMDSSTSQSCTTLKTAHTTVFNNLPQKLSSWTLSFSLLARITLVSAGRTPLEELLGTTRNKAIPEEARFQSLLVKIEEVKVAQADVTKVVSSGEVSFSRLPPPQDSGPSLSPSGLFATTEKSAISQPRQRRQSLNKQILLKKETGKNAFAAQSTETESYTNRNSLIEERRGTASETSNKILAAVRTTNLSLNFRNAESLMFAMCKKNNDDMDLTLEELSDEDDEDFSEDEGEEDVEIGVDDDPESGNFIERMALERLQSLGDCVIDDNERSPLKTPASADKFHLYADMMTEAESVEMLKRGSAKERLVVMDALSAKKDRMLEQGKWKETKLDENRQFQKNLEKNKEYIDEVIRMFNLRAQLEDSKPKTNDFSIRWKEIMEKNRSGLRNESILKQSGVDSPERKILSMMKRQEIKQDRTSLRALE